MPPGRRAHLPVRCTQTGPAAGEEIPGESLPAGRQVAAYLIRATFSQKRMDYSPEQATVVYGSKDGKEKKTYDACLRRQIFTRMSIAGTSIRGRTTAAWTSPGAILKSPVDVAIGSSLWFEVPIISEGALVPNILTGRRERKDRRIQRVPKPGRLPVFHTLRSRDQACQRLLSLH